MNNNEQSNKTVSETETSSGSLNSLAVENSPSSTPTTSNVSAENAFRNERDALAEGAARVYETLLPQWEKQVYNLSKKGLTRVLLALIKVPLSDYDKKLDKVEKNVYALSERLLQSKFLLEHLVMQEEIENNQNKKDNENV